MRKKGMRKGNMRRRPDGGAIIGSRWCSFAAASSLVLHARYHSRRSKDRAMHSGIKWRSGGEVYPCCRCTRASLNLEFMLPNRASITRHMTKERLSHAKRFLPKATQETGALPCLLHPSTSLGGVSGLLALHLTSSQVHAAYVAPGWIGRTSPDPACL